MMKTILLDTKNACGSDVTTEGTTRKAQVDLGDETQERTLTGKAQWYCRAAI